MTAENTLSQLYNDTFNAAPAEVKALAGAGSNRLYFRLTGSDASGIRHNVIGTIGTDPHENRAFIELSRHFRSQGIPVPEVIAVSSDGAAYLQDDLGDLSLFEAIASGRAKGSFSAEEMQLLERSIRMMVKLHRSGSRDFDWTCCYPEQAMDGNMIRWDLSYFKYCFLKLSGVEFSESRLETEFSKLFGYLAERAEKARGFMARDFQSRNVMIHDGQPFLIDFQGGRRGPSEYDVASFLWQARAGLCKQVREYLVDLYVRESIQADPSFDECGFRTSLPRFVLFRMLQTLGAYGLRGLHENKPHFLASLPTALRNVSEHLHKSGLEHDFPYLADVIRMASKNPAIEKLSRLTAIKPFDGLTVTVTSFSYKKGVPTDLSGNGGGFVFDCRAVHNPGRYDEYKALTGRDRAVRDFLEADGEILEFLSHVNTLVDSSVSRYIRRGFKSLCVNFGCTGGQHRSVYSAETTARHLSACFPQIRVVLHHREQDILETIEPSI